MNISRVCKSWYRIIAGLRLLNKTTFNDCFQNGRICWKQSEHKTSPTQRHSHSCCQINDRMYLFGGLSGTSTSYNDLWYLDLNNKTWNRPATNGLYPSPKAAASLLAYNNQLVLYGGYSHPYSHPFNQQVSFFDELHIYCIDTFTWNQILFSQEAPKLAGHSASIINKNQMIFFGGCNGSLGNKTNSVYCIKHNDMGLLFLFALFLFFCFTGHLSIGPERMFNFAIIWNFWCNLFTWRFRGLSFYSWRYFIKLFSYRSSFFFCPSMVIME